MSTNAAELRSVVKRLSSCTNTEEYLGVLGTLKKDFVVNEAVLRESKAGLAVGKLRSHASKEVADAAKDLVKKWKTDVEKAKAGGGSGNTTPTTTSRKNSVASSPAVTTTTQSSVRTNSSLASNKSTSQEPARTAKSDGVKFNITDKTRDKCAELVYDSLVIDSGFPADLIRRRAEGIERAVFDEFGGTSAEYKSKIRTLFVNLKDKKNPGLRESVVSGDLAIEKFCKMSSAEMASEDRKAEDRKIEEENLHNSLGAAEQAAETEAFQCGRCKQRKCRYRQAQTRSADEPMTTFVTCTNCGNRWKFS